MLSTIKRKQTLLVKWLISIGCTIVNIANSGSTYLRFSTTHTGAHLFRISDHLSNKNEYIHVIMTPLNNTVTVIYKSFLWTGDFNGTKTVLYTLVMNKPECSVKEAPKIEDINTIEVYREDGGRKTILLKDLRSLDQIPSYGPLPSLVKEEIEHILEKDPTSLYRLALFIKRICSKQESQKLKELIKLKREYGVS